MSDEQMKPDRAAERDAPDRAAERDDVAAPDAPTAAEENEGLSTILSGEPADGVQDNAGEK